ncbi:MAG: patatin-like phospholipase family protein [Acidimicrobiales bacterium]
MSTGAAACPDSAARPTFVLSGGGNLGAIQVGMIRAFAEEGIDPGMIVGTSVGAINGAFLAGHSGPDGSAEIERLWSSLRRRDVLGLHPRALARGLTGRQDYVFDAGPLRRLLDSFIGFDLLEESPVRLAVVATDLGSGEPVILRSGDATTALLASSAVPGLLPAVALDGRLLVDGAVAADVPLCEAVALGSTEVLVLATAPAQLENLRRRFAACTPHRSAERPQVKVKIVPPLEVTVPFAALDQSRQLADLGYRRTRRWIDEGMPQSFAARCDGLGQAGSRRATPSRRRRAGRMQRRRAASSRSGATP